MARIGIKASYSFSGFYTYILFKMRQLSLFIVIPLFLSCSDDSTTTTGTAQPEETVARHKTSDTTKLATATITEKPATDSAYLIMPGQLIGQVSLGETAEKINSTLGKADSGDAAMGKALAFWYGKQNRKQNFVAVYFIRGNENGQENLFARQIRVNSPSFKTIVGVGPGSNISTVRQHHTLQPIAYFVNPQQQRTYIFDDTAEGIAFEVSTPDSICTAITIHKKEESITNTYLPIHPEMVRLAE